MLPAEPARSLPSRDAGRDRRYSSPAACQTGAAMSGVEHEYLPPAAFDLTAVAERLPAPLHVDGLRSQRSERAFYDTFDCRLRSKQLRLVHETGFLRLFGAGGREVGAVQCESPSETIRLVVERSYADYASSRFPNAQARLDDLEQLSQYALRYEDVRDIAYPVLRHRIIMNFHAEAEGVTPEDAIDEFLAAIPGR